MSSVVAIVKSIVGQVIAVSPEGIRRVLVEGDRLFAGEQVLTGPGGAVTLELADGRMLDLGRDSQWSADAPASSTDLSAATAQSAPSVEELQQAIAAGADPTTDLEAPAAGPGNPGTGGAAGGGHTFVIQEETAGVVDPTVGYPTEGLSSGATLQAQEIGGVDGNGATAAATPTPVPATTAVALSATPSITEAGGVVVYTATVGQAPSSDLTVTLSNGATIIIGAGQTSGSVNVDIAANDTVYIDGSEISATITGASGGGLTVNIDDTPAVTQITDTIDTTVISLAANPSVTEGGVITYTATLSNPAQTAVTVTLSNGQVITIAAGASSGSVDFQTPANDIYVNGGTLSATITAATGGNFENLVADPAAATTVIADSVDITPATLTATPSVTEGGVITYTVTLGNPAQTPITVTLSNGQTITVGAGQTTGSVDFQTPANDVYVNGSTVTTSITGATGGNFENLVPNLAPISTSINDSVDTVTVSIVSNGDVTEAQQPAFTVRVNQALDRDLTVTLTNGAKVVIAAGQTEAVYRADAQGDDVFKDAGSLTLGVREATVEGASFENLQFGGSATVQIADTISDVVATLTADKTTVTEGGQITYTVTLSNADGLPVTGHDGLRFTLTDGTVVEIAKGSATGTATITVADDVFVGGQPAIAQSITGVTGAERFENLVSTGSTSTTITDETGTPSNPGTPGTPNGGDAVTVSIAADQPSVTEDQPATFTITLNRALERDLTVTLSNGDTTVVKAGSLTGTYTLAAQGEDVLKDGQTVQLGVRDAVDAGGKSFENLQIDTTPASLQINDTINEVVATLTADKTTVTEGGQVTYTVTLISKDGLPVTGHKGMTFTLEGGGVVTIEAGKASGSYVLTTADDVYVGGQASIVKSITGITGGNVFEKLSTSGSTCTIVTDELGTPNNPGSTGTPNGGDLVTVGIAADQPSVTEDKPATFTVTLNRALERDLTVTLTNGSVVTVKAGETTARYTLAAQGEDVFKDGETLQLGVKSAVDVGGKSFENLQIDATKASLQVLDTTNEVVATLTADKSTVTEGGQVTYTVTLSNAQGLPVTGHGGLTFTLGDGSKVLIANGSASGSVVVTAKDDVYTGGQADMVNKLVSVSGGESFEKLTLGGETRTTVVIDEPGSGVPGSNNQGDKVLVTIVGNGDVTEAQQPSFTVKVNQALDRDLTVTLSNDAKVVIAAGQTQVEYKAPVQGEDVFKDAGSLTVGIKDAAVTGKAFENLQLGGAATVQISDTTSEVIATLSADKASVIEGNTFTYTVTLTNAQGLPVTGHNGLTFTLSDGTKVAIAAGSASGSATVTAPDDVFIGGHATIVNKLVTVAGGDIFEKLTMSQDEVFTSVKDESGSGVPGAGNQGDKVSVSIVGNGDVTEAQQPSFTVKVSQKLDQPLTVTLSNGAQVVIEAGQTQVEYKAPVQGEDVFKDAGSLTLSVQDAAVVGKSFENLDINSSATVQISDTINEVVATLTADKTTVTEGGQLTYTVNLSNAQGLPVGGHNGLSFTLSDGTLVKVAAGSTSGSATITVKDDAYTGGQADIVNKLVSVSGGENFEKLTLGGETRTTSVTDEAAGQGDLTTLAITGDSSVIEGATAHYTLTLSNPAKSEVTVTLSYSGTASNGQDYTGVTTVKIPANASSASFDIKTIDDPLVEGSENFVVKIAGATGGNFENLAMDAGKSSVTTTIIDNDNAPVSTGGAVTGKEDTDYVFTWDNFKVTDADGNTGLNVTITKLPDLGSLKFFNGSAWVDVSLNQTVSQADIGKGYLKFVPLANQSGVDGYGGSGVGNKQADYAQVKFKPNDGTNLGAEATLKIDIAPVADQPALNIASNTVNSLGLTKETWTSLNGLGTNGNGLTGEALKTVFANSGSASKSETTTNVQSDSSVTAQTGSKTSGLIYLEAGKVYTFSGTADDSLYVTLGGKSVVTATWGAGGSISGSFTPATSGYYPIEVYHANQSGPGSYDLNVKVGNGAVTDLNSANFPMYQSLGEMTGAGLTPSDAHTNGNGQTYYDGYKLNEGPENGSVKLVGISSALTDTDGSESLSVKLGGIPSGSVLSDNAGHSVTVGASAVDVTGWNLGSLAIKPPAYYYGQFDVKVSATSSESVGGSTASSEGTLKVTVYPDSYTTTNLTSESDTYTGGTSSDIIVADVTGLHVVAGKDYNIAFIVDTSGSMGSAGVNAAKSSLESVFKTLAASVKGSMSGTVNVLLVDFASQVKSNVSVTLNDAGLKTLLNSLSTMSAGGGTNYEDAFKTTANWFQNLKDAGNSGSNQTYFVTDGQPTFYQSNENTNPTLGSSGVTMDAYLSSYGYQSGGSIAGRYLDSNTYVSVDNGVLSVSTKTWSFWTGYYMKTVLTGEIHAEGNGGYELSSRYGTGSSTDDATLSNSLSSFKLLSGLSNVEAIGLNSDISANDLKAYDSDQKPQTNIDPSKLADAILGHTETTVPGNDTINGGDGNDILFGDLVTFSSVAGTGVEAVQGYVAAKLGVDAGSVDARTMHQYVSEHYTEFDVSRSNDGGDFLNGGNGNDIIFGQGGNDYLDGGKGNDILLGGAGSDTLLGGEGDDILIGGKGNDTMTGGSGADTFVWKAGDTGSDVIKDFKASEGDRLDLKDLLQGEKASTIDNFLKITTAGGDTTLQVSSEGKLNAAGGLANADVTIKLEGVNWSNTTINSLISGADPTIKIHNNDS